MTEYQLIVEAFENCGETVQSYSGRGMYGKRCLGVTCDNPMATLLSMIDSFTSQAGDMGEVQDLIQELGRPQTDSMGLSSILYFPDVEWQEPEHDDECDHGASLDDHCDDCPE